MRKLFFLLFLFTISINIFGQKLTIAVAANVQFAMQEIKQKFEKDTGIDVSVVIGSSGKLTAQIENGAPFDVFLSADMKYPGNLYKNGYAKNKPKIYASGSLVLWSMSGADLSEGIQVLTDASINNIAVANPKTAPYGRETIRVLKFYKLYNKVKSRLVFGSSIAQTNQYIVSKSADLGFTAKSVVLSPEMKNMGRWIDIDSSAYTPINQGAVILTHGMKQNLKASERFFNFLFSPEAINIFKEYGYKVN